MYKQRVVMKADTNIQLRVSGNFKEKLNNLANRKHTHMSAIIVAAIVAQYPELELKNEN